MCLFAEVGKSAVSVNKFPIFDHIRGYSAKAAASNCNAATMHRYQHISMCQKGHNGRVVLQSMVYCFLVRSVIPTKQLQKIDIRYRGVGPYLNPGLALQWSCQLRHVTCVVHGGKHTYNAVPLRHAALAAHAEFP